MDVVYKNLSSLLLMGEKLATELPIFEEKLDNENEVLVLSRKSDQTEEIEVGDDQRDSGLSGYAQVLKGFLYLKSGEQYEAAKKLDKHLSDFNLSPRMSLIKQTGAMKNLIEDLETTYTSQVTSLGLTPFVTMMKEGNTAVDTNLQARDARSAGKMKAAVLTARSETDEIYNNQENQRPGDRRRRECRRIRATDRRTERPDQTLQGTGIDPENEEYRQQFYLR